MTCKVKLWIRKVRWRFEMSKVEEENKTQPDNRMVHWVARRSVTTTNNEN
jgi:hypothetical protein